MIRVAACPICQTGWESTVIGGSTSFAHGTSSNITTEMSSGTRNRRSRMAVSAASPSTLLLAMSAVGGSSTTRSRSALAYAVSRVKRVCTTSCSSTSTPISACARRKPSVRRRPLVRGDVQLINCAVGEDDVDAEAQSALPGTDVVPGGKGNDAVNALFDEQVDVLLLALGVLAARAEDDVTPHGLRRGENPLGELTVKVVRNVGDNEADVVSGLSLQPATDRAGVVIELTRCLLHAVSRRFRDLALLGEHSGHRPEPDSGCHRDILHGRLLH